MSCAERKVSHQLSALAAQLLPLLPVEDLQTPFESGLPACVERISCAASELQRRAAAAVEGVMAALRDVGSLLGLLALLDVSIAHASTLQFIQAAPWLGLVPSPSHNRLLQLLRVNPSDLPPHEAFTPRGLRHRSPRHRPSHESRRETKGGGSTRAEAAWASVARGAAGDAAADDDCRGDAAVRSGADGQGMDQGRDGFLAARGGEGEAEDGQMGFPPEISLPPAAAAAAAADGPAGPDAAASAADGSLLELHNQSHGSRRSDPHDKPWHVDPPQAGPPPPPAPPAAPLTDLLQRVCASVPVVRSSMLGMLQAAQVAEAIYWGSVQADSLFAHALSILSTSLHPFLPLLAPPVEPWAAKGRKPREFHHLHSLLLAGLSCGSTHRVLERSATGGQYWPSPLTATPTSHSLNTPQSLPLTVPHSGPLPSSSPANLPEPSSKSGPLTRPSRPGGSAAGHTERAGSAETFPGAGGMGRGRGEEEGDAVVWGGSVVVHLLGQQRRFELDDPCWHAVAVSDYESICSGGEGLGGFGAGADGGGRGGGGGGGVMLGVIGSAERQRGKKAAAAAAAREAEARLQQLKAQATAFVENARRLQQVSQQAFILFAAQAPLPPKAARVCSANGLPTATCFPTPPFGSSAPPSAD
ncbi:unnamed protein product [Closterium sp. NIES-64]|nr:unnamed protein product [Closterium sp. NIES-64]